MTVHLPGLVHALQKKSGGVKLVLGTQALIKYRIYHTIFCLKNFTPDNLFVTTLYI